MYAPQGAKIGGQNTVSWCGRLVDIFVMLVCIWIREEGGGCFKLFRGAYGVEGRPSLRKKMYLDWTVYRPTDASCYER